MVQCLKWKGIFYVEYGVMEYNMHMLLLAYNDMKIKNRYIFITLKLAFQIFLFIKSGDSTVHIGIMGLHLWVHSEC